jgi:hypothetical protein
MRTSFKKRLRCVSVVNGLTYRPSILLNGLSFIDLSDGDPVSIVPDDSRLYSALSDLSDFELWPPYRLESIAALFADGFPFAQNPTILFDTPLFEVILLALKEENELAIHLALQCIDTIFQAADAELFDALLHHILAADILRCIIGRFHFLRRSPDSIGIGCSFAEKLLRMTHDAHLAHMILTGLSGGIFHCLVDLSWTEAPPKLWSFLTFLVLSRFRPEKTDRLMKFVVSLLLPQLEEIDLADPESLLPDIEMIEMFTAVVNPNRPPWLSLGDHPGRVPRLLLEIVGRAQDGELTTASVRLLAEHAKWSEGLVPPDAAPLSVDMFTIRPDLVRDSAETAYAIFLDAPDEDQWFGCAMWALGFGDNPPAAEPSLEGKVFYAACISVCSQRHDDWVLPPAEDFLPFLCLLLTTGISDPNFVDSLVWLLLRYADICTDNQDGACFLRAVEDPETCDALGERLAEYLDAGCDKVLIVLRALQDFRMEIAE